jgi:hypothetical protein
MPHFEVTATLLHDWHPWMSYQARISVSGAGSNEIALVQGMFVNENQLIKKIFYAELPDKVSLITVVIHSGI